MKVKKSIELFLLDNLSKIKPAYLSVFKIYQRPVRGVRAKD